MNGERGFLQGPARVTTVSLGESLQRFLEMCIQTLAGLFRGEEIVDLSRWPQSRLKLAAHDNSLVILFGEIESQPLSDPKGEVLNPFARDFEFELAVPTLRGEPVRIKLNPSAHAVTPFTGRVSGRMRVQRGGALELDEVEFH